MDILGDKKIALIALLAPGQATKVRPDLESLRQDANLDDLVGRLIKTTEGFLGHAADHIMSTTGEELLENTRMAQVATYIDSMTIYFSLMHYSSGKKDPPLLEKMKSEDLRFAVSGDSCGNVTSAYVPGYGNLEEQIVKYFAPGLFAMDMRGEILMDTPHSGDYGGLGLILKPNLKEVRKLIAEANRNVNSEYKVKWVKTNAPGIHAVAGTREALDYLSAHAAEVKGKFLGPISPYWFHHSEIMEPASRKFLEVIRDQPLRRPEHVYISNTTGHTLYDTWKIKRDLAQGIKNPVRFFTEEGPSVVNTMKTLGITDAAVINKETANWLNGTGITPHLITDFQSLSKAKYEINNILAGEKSMSPVDYSRTDISTQTQI